jgi:hypothetical protein
VLQGEGMIELGDKGLNESRRGPCKDYIIHINQKIESLARISIYEE